MNSHNQVLSTVLCRHCIMVLYRKGQHEEMSFSEVRDFGGEALSSNLNVSYLTARHSGHLRIRDLNLTKVAVVDLIKKHLARSLPRILFTPYAAELASVSWPIVRTLGRGGQGQFKAVKADEEKSIKLQPICHSLIRSSILDVDLAPMKLSVALALGPLTPIAAVSHKTRLSSASKLELTKFQVRRHRQPRLMKARITDTNLTPYCTHWVTQQKS